MPDSGKFSASLFVDGKPFTRADFDSGLRKAVISVTLARRLYGDNAPVGRTFVLDSDEYQVCGVVKDVSFITPATYGRHLVAADGRC